MVGVDLHLLIKSSELERLWEFALQIAHVHRSRPRPLNLMTDVITFGFIHRDAIKTRPRPHECHLYVGLRSGLSNHHRIVRVASGSGHNGPIDHRVSAHT